MLCSEITLACLCRHRTIFASFTETKAQSAPELKPGALLILPVLISKCFFQHFGFFARANDLDGSCNRKHKQKNWPMNRDEEARDHNLSEKINRIADFRIQPAGNELTSLWRYRKRSS